MAPLAELSQLPVPSDAFDRFPGRWVAVRNEMVVADAETLGELDANPNVMASDVRFRVPEPDAHFF